MARNAHAYALSANDLLTGEQVFWSHQGRWCLSFEDALFSTEPQNLTPLGNAEEAANRVVGAALIPVDENRRPVELRDQRRLQGVSVAVRTTASEAASRPSAATLAQAA